MAINMITLYFKEGSSDKVYQAWLEESGTGFMVHFAYGRRGSTLNTGVKTSSPVSEAEANKIYNQLVREKKGKGYTEGESGAVYKDTDNEDRYTDLLPMLLNSVNDKELQLLLDNDDWIAQPKIDGKRVMIRKFGTDITAINRKGLAIGIPEMVIEAARKIPGDFILDGEMVGEEYYAFDLIEPGTFYNRYAHLTVLLGLKSVVPLVLVPIALGNWKRSMYEGLKQHNGEGIVFKHRFGKYMAGRPSSGGYALKYKFTQCCTCMVREINKNRRSVGLDMWNGRGELYDVGNVTIPPNFEMPDIGEIVEIRYLYAYKGGSLYQPVYLGPRDDADVDDISSLKYKNENTEEEEGDK